MQKTWLFILALLLCQPMFAREEDTRHLLEEMQRFNPMAVQSADMPNTADSGSPVYIDIEGKTYQVGKSKEALERGIYYAVNYRNWTVLHTILQRYQRLPETRLALVKMALALQAKDQNQHKIALKTMQEAHNLDKTDVRIRLELARLLAEDKQSKEAIKQFSALLQENLPPPTQAVVGQYLNGLQSQNRWHGMVSLGMGYNNNINQANGQTLCALMIAGQCAIVRRLPTAQGSTLGQYRLILSRQIPLFGNHALLIRPLSYGTFYRQKDKNKTAMNDYSHNTALIYAAYRYADADKEWTISPYFEHDYRNRHSHYHAFGVEISWQQKWASRWRTTLQTDHKRFHYKGENKRYFANYSRHSMSLGVDYALSEQVGLFAGMDWIRNQYSVSQSSNRAKLFRIGAYAFFADKVHINASLWQRHNQYDAFNGILGKKRYDKQQTATLSVGLLRWQYRGIYPELRWQRSLNKSNVDFYRYRQNQMTLALNYRF